MESVSEAVRWSNVAIRAANDKNAFEELYNHFFPRVYRYLLGKVADSDVADEIISETFWKVYDHLSEYDIKKGAFSTWLYRIAQNELNQYWRKKSYRVEHESDLEEDFELSAPNSDEPEQILVQKEVQNKIRAALEKLPERERKIIELTYWLGYPPRKIAQMLDMTPNHVSVTLKRAKNTLKTYLQDLAD